MIEWKIFRSQRIDTTFRPLSSDSSRILRIPITFIRTLQYFEQVMTVDISLDSLLYKRPVVDSFLSLIFDWLWALSVSLQFLFNRQLFLLIAGSKLKNSLTKWQSPPQNFRKKNHSFSATDRIHSSVVNIWSHSFLFCLLISSSLSLILSPTVSNFHFAPLSFTAPLGRPSPPSNSFIPSFHLTITLHLSLFCPRHNSIRRYLFMRVLSHSNTHYLWGYMVCCGCHERCDQSRSSQGYMGWCGCHEILIILCYPQEVCCPDKKFSRQPTFSFCMIRVTLRDRNEE